MSIDLITDRLDGVKRNGKGYIAKCPAHDDNSPSLSLMETDDHRILMHCFAGCTPQEVLGSIGLTMSNLFPTGGLGEFRSFQRINDEIKARKSAAQTEDELILKIAAADRKAGKRLSKQDLERERQAYLRTRK